MPPTLKQLVEHIVLACASVIPFVTLFYASCNFRTVHTYSKVHIWIPYGKIADPYVFSCLSYARFWSYAPFKMNGNLVSKISKPEGHWSCIAHLSAEDMLKPAVIEEKKPLGRGRQPIRAKIFNVNRKASSLWSFVASLKRISSTSDFIHIIS